MRGFLLFLALAFPVALSSPSFWALVGMSWGATPVTYGYHDGTRQQALLGPKAPWPDWAVRPDSTEFVVSAWFEDTPARPGSGHGDFDFNGDGREAALAYAARLRGEGWDVETLMFRGATPSIPPRPLHICTVNARRSEHDQRVLHAGFQISPGSGAGTMHWATRPMPGWARRSSEAC